jgi:hypothetical protein
MANVTHDYALTGRVASAKDNLSGRKCNEDQYQSKNQTGGHLSDYVVLFCNISLG